MIAKLLHIANSSPPGNRAEREQFYAMKQRILHRFGNPDHNDIQYIPGKKCWSCGGTGIWRHTYSGDEDYCWKCDGSGWFKQPVWVTLQRWRLGRFVFHEPIERRYSQPLGRAVKIEGYVEHKAYAYRQVRRSMIILGLMFDWSVARPEIADWLRSLWVTRMWSKRCIYCRHHLWAARGWKCKRCLRRGEAAEFYDDAPF